MDQDQVVKSPNDTRRYRAIRLDNGLKALLVSDLQSLEEPTVDFDEDATDAESILSDSEEEDMEEGSGSDTRDEEVKNLTNNHKTSISKQKKANGEKLSAAALCISVGSFSDPKEIPGLAHFLEHMVFMGSEKYPDENQFESFLTAHGGSSNAYTDCERTVFYFDVRKNKFKEALDIFAQFFISPLMKKDSVDREIKAVDSEFDISKPSDKNRKEQLLGSFAKEGHPMGKFMWGSLESLKTTPSANGIDIYDNLQVFHKANYSSQFMTLAVQSRDELDLLEEWITESFSKIPNNGKTNPSFNHLSEPFNTEKFFKLHKVIPVKNINHVELTWCLPCLQQHYRTKPLHYLDWLIGHEGKGSILSYLKKKYWATKLVSGNSESGFEHNSTNALFTVGVTLTESGMDNVEEVIHVIFEYLAMLRKVGPQRRIFNEIQQIEDNDFRWREQGDPVDYVDALSVSMQLFPVEHYLTGDELLFEYNDELVKHCLSYLVPSKSNICLSSKRYEQESICNMKEKWYQTSYCVGDIPKSWIDKWENVKPREDIFHIPVANDYIASDFSIKEADVFSSVYPQAVTDTEHSRLWYKKDSKFKVPKAYCNFQCITPVISESPQNACLVDLFIRALDHKLNEVAYAADVALLSYEVKTTDIAFIIKVSGFNHKLFKLFKTIVDHVCSFDISEELFNAVKDEQQKSYYNAYIKPSELERDIRLQILRERHWTAIDKQVTLKSITRDMLLQFIVMLKAEMFIEGLIQGNITATEAKEYENCILTSFSSRPLRKNVHPTARVTELPVGQWFCRAENLNPQDNNSVIINYYQHGPVSIREFSLNDLLAFKMEEPCFNTLRTRDQLGYIVYNMNRDTDGIVAFSVTVTSQIDKFSMQQLDDRIEAFLIEFEAILDNMTLEEFNDQRDSLIGLKKCEDTHLGQEVKRNWYEIRSENYVFDRISIEIAALESLSCPEFLDWYKSYILGSGNCRKLSVQIMGHVPSTAKGNERRDIPTDLSVHENETMHHTSDIINTPVIKYLTVDVTQNKVIMDPIKFKQKNKLFPVSKIIH